MPRRKKAPVAASRGAGELLAALGFGGDVVDAVERGVIERRKIVGRWLYFEPAVDLEAVIEEVFTAADDQIQAWLLAPTPFLRHPVARAVGGSVTADAVEVIIPELVRTHRFGALPLLTQSYQPYLAMYSWDDTAEIDRQLRALRERLEQNGSVRQAALPEPARARAAAGWKSSILKHGEFLGLGRVQDAALIGWE